MRVIQPGLAFPHGVLKTPKLGESVFDEFIKGF